jgi:hypothetical protein
MRTALKTLGNIGSLVLLGLLYYGLVTPLGFVLRSCGRDRLSLRKPATETYWTNSSS